MFKNLLATLALCACASFALAGIYGRGSSYGSAPGLVGIPVPQYPILGYPAASLADSIISIGSDAEAAGLLNLAVSLPPARGPIVGVNPVYQGLPAYGNYGARY